MVSASGQTEEDAVVTNAQPKFFSSLKSFHVTHARLCEAKKRGDNMHRDRVAQVADTSVLKVVDLFLRDPEFGQNLLVRNSLVMLRPFSSFRESLLVCGCEWFVVNRSIRNRARRDPAAAPAYQSRRAPGPGQAARSVRARVVCLPP
jgi:hypothetical protein